MTVRVGAQFREETGESFSVTDFKTIGKVALLQLDDDIDLRAEAQVVSLVQEGQSTAQGDVLLVSGYGDLFVRSKQCSQRRSSASTPLKLYVDSTTHYSHLPSPKLDFIRS